MNIFLEFQLDGYHLNNLTREMEILIFPDPLHRLKLLLFRMRVVNDLTEENEKNKKIQNNQIEDFSSADEL